MTKDGRTQCNWFDIGSKQGQAWFERQLQQKIIRLRPDMAYVTVEGKQVPGLVQLYNNPIQESCQPTTLGTVLMAMGAAVSALVPFSWPIFIAQIAAQAAQLVKTLEDMRRMKQAAEKLQKAALLGSSAIIADRNLELLIRSGQLTDKLTYEEAIDIPVSRRAWEVGMILGLPHPAMICKRDKPCNNSQVEAGLLEAINKVWSIYRLELQNRLEEELQNYPKWLAMGFGPLPDVNMSFGDGYGKYQGLYPAIIVRDGKAYLRTVEIKNHWYQHPNATRTDEPTVEIFGERSHEILLEPGIGFDGIIEWLQWRRDPDMLPLEVAGPIKQAVNEMRLATGTEIKIDIYPPVTVFGGRFTRPDTTIQLPFITGPSGSATSTTQLPTPIIEVPDPLTNTLVDVEVQTYPRPQFSLNGQVIQDVAPGYRTFDGVLYQQQGVGWAKVPSEEVAAMQTASVVGQSLPLALAGLALWLLLRK